MHDNGLSNNLGKTKVMVFKTTPQWIRRSAPAFTYGLEIVDFTYAYTYLGMAFNNPLLSFKSAVKTRPDKSDYSPGENGEDVLTRSVPGTSHKTLAL